MVPFDGQYMSSYLMALVMLALFFTIYEIFPNEIKCRKFDLENEGQRVVKLDLRHSIANVRFCVGILFRIVAIQQHTIT